MGLQLPGARPPPPKKKIYENGQDLGRFSTASPAPRSQQCKGTERPRNSRRAHERHELRVCKLVVAHHVQQVAQVMAAAQNH